MRTPRSVEAPSLIDALTSVMRDQIIAGDLKPGERLTELWVSSTFQVARPTAKASLDRLTNDGLLRRGPRRSAIVPRLTADDVADIYLSREPVESRAVEALAAGGELPSEAERALRLMEVAARDGASAEHTRADIAFHRALVAAVGSERLTRMHDTVMGESELCIAQVRSHTGLDLVKLTLEHIAIAHAIKRGDCRGAVEALQHDLHECRDLLIADAQRMERGPNGAAACSEDLGASASPDSSIEFATDGESAAGI